VRHLFLYAAFLGAAGFASATVSLPTLISDNMVLQRDAKARLWGKAAAGEKITAKIAGATAETTADADGRWSLHLDELKAGGPYELVIQGTNTLTIKNVLVGEVWVASGQSNMGFPLRNAKNDAEIAKANFPEIRYFAVLKTVSGKPLDTATGRWLVVQPTQNSAGSMSAVSYYFARDLQDRLKVPVGMITSALGGTDIEAWVAPSEVESRKDLEFVRQRWAEDLKKWPALKEQYDKGMAAWQEEWKKAAAAGTRPKNGPPREPRGPGTQWEAGSLYNGMIAPISPYTIKGFIWYQGENNTNNGVGYAPLLTALIESWRKTWGSGDLPFLFMQLPACRKAMPEPGESGWADLRESQQKNLKLPNTGMAVTLDLGLKAEGNLHPPDKTEFARRLALQAMHLVYGDNSSVVSGPVFKDAKADGPTMKVTFDEVHGGLTTDPSGAPVKGFTIAGADKIFHWADAKIDGDTVIVSSAKVPKPVAVRYGWADLPDVNLFNKDGFPAAPFRSDDWPKVPRGSTHIEAAAE